MKEYDRPELPGADAPSAPHEAQHSGGGFTPGPWVFYAATDARPHTVAAAGWHICEVHHYGYDVVRHPNAHKIQTANARLIAAAPELYEALSELVGVIDSPEMHGVWHEMLTKLSAYNGPRFDVETARAAIAKAVAGDSPSPPKAVGQVPGRSS